MKRASRRPNVLLALAAIASCRHGGHQATMTVSFASPTPGAVVGPEVPVAVDVVGGTDPVTVTFVADGESLPIAAPYHATLNLLARDGARVTLVATAMDAHGARASDSVEVTVSRPAADAAAPRDAAAPADGRDERDVAARLDTPPQEGGGAAGGGGDLAPGATGVDAGGPADAPVDSALPADGPRVKVTKLTLTPASCARAIVGRGLQLRAWGDFADGSHREVTTEVAWSSKATERASVGAQTGRVTGVATGKAVITASVDDVSAQLEVTVADWHVGTVEPDALLDDFRGDETGNAAGVWRVPEIRGRIGIAYRLYDAAKDTWGALVPQDTGTAGTIEDARVGLNQNSDLFLLWVLHEPGTSSYEVWHSSRVLGQWTSGRLSRASADAQGLGLAIDRHGSAFASYSDPTLGTTRELWSVRHTTRDGWAQPIAIGSPGSVGSLAFDRLGNTRALWRGASGMASRLFDRMTATWGTLEPVTGGAGADFSSLGGERLGVDADGNAVAAWLAPQPSKVNQVVASRLGRGTGWAEAMVLNTTTESGDFPAAAAGLGGHMLVAWQQHLQGAAWAIFARAYEPGRGWQEATELGPIPGSGPHNDARISIAPDGTTAVAWAGDGLQVRFYYPGHGWSDRETVAQSSGGLRPRVVIDSSCNTQVVWERDGAQVYDTVSARLRAD